MSSPTVHEDVLQAALRICTERGDWTFEPVEIVRALPHRNATSVRTHIVSRCCVNAPKNHSHKWDYFRRVARGRYEILAPLRRRPARRVSVARETGPERDTVHAVIFRSGDTYVVECMELAVVTQGHTLDEALANARDAISLHLDGEDAAAFGLTSHPRLSVTYETALV